MPTTRTGDRHTPTGAGGASTLSDMPATVPDAGSTADVAVDVRGLRCTYGSYEAVRGIDLDARRGELLAVLGTNGAGKTTTLDALRGTRAPDGGTVRVLGLDPHRQRRPLAARIGVMLQDTALPDELTPTEMLGLWRHLADGAPRHRGVVDSLARVGLTHRRDVRIGQLSGGERRRLDLAVALSTDPELMFLDEPTAGLDPEARADTWELIRDQLRHGTTVVLTTHYLEEAEALADRLVILHAGRVEVTGTLDEVLGTRGARIHCELPHDAAPPADALVGRATVTSDRGVRRLVVHTPDPDRDLAALLAWSRRHGTELRRLQVSQGSLAEIFHDVTTIPKEDPR